MEKICQICSCVYLFARGKVRNRNKNLQLKINLIKFDLNKFKLFIGGL